jgi:hypothetical protein
MAMPRIPNPAEQMRKAMPTQPSTGRAGVVTPPAVNAAVNRIQPVTAPAGTPAAAPAGRPPNTTVSAAPAPAQPAPAPAPAATSTGNSWQRKKSAAGAAGVNKGEMGQLRGGILGALNTGLEGLYSPDDRINAISGLKGDVEAGTQSQLDAADADAARRGLFRSGMAGSRAASIRRAGSADFSRMANDMKKAMREADMTTRMGAAGQATDFLRGEEEMNMRRQQMRRAASAAAAANAPIQLFNEETGQMESIDPRMLQFMNAL